MIIQKQNGKVVPVQNTSRERFKMVAKTMMGLEEVLAEELKAAVPRTSSAARAP